ncbi:large-conductance mechanosensitive channel protein MscL [Paenibacillus sp. LHD-117]|uniref:large-conductance mechanosensitive channel protein MscL n=1 Tax=Paenibacillus sp. LHD-117 TaxID=3071412 RepID=UPI0027E18895|nr:large-conductance mechanosensitive channel protein MscL [Paenibacillus sp. LHD-117]MDQ6421336.1 large-conductance mechanosensitive channel protein MscL [Paenibacillus sp. LHD-117]
MKIVKEFKEFAMRGNVIDLAVGVIIGGAFGKIVTSLVNDIIMPPIGRLLGGINFRDLKVALVDPSTYTGKPEELPYIKYGQFINVLLDFVIVAFCIFLLVKGINALRRKKEEPEKAPADPTEKECPYCLSQVPIKATRCKHCTSHLEENAANA